MQRLAQLIKGEEGMARDAEALASDWVEIYQYLQR